MRNMANAAEYFMFFKWKSKILVCLCIFYKNYWVKNKGTVAFRENCYDFNETAAAPKLLSLFNRSPSCWKAVV